MGLFVVVFYNQVGVFGISLFNLRGLGVNDTQNYQMDSFFFSSFPSPFLFCADQVVVITIQTRDSSSFFVVLYLACTKYWNTNVP